MRRPLPLTIRGAIAHGIKTKSAETIAANRQKLGRLGINYLLNVGPDGLGRIPLKSQQILRRAAELFQA